MDNSTSAHFGLKIGLLTTTPPSTLLQLTTDSPPGTPGASPGVGVVAANTGYIAGMSLDAVTTAFSAYVLLLMVINVCLNGLVIFAVLYLQRGRLKSSQLVLLQLSISDLLIALLYLPFLLVLLLSDSAVADCRMLCAALGALERGLIAASIWGIAFVSLDRYLYIVKHHSYRSAMTLRRSLGGAAAVWMIALVFGVTSFLVSAHFRDDSGACVCHLTLDFYGFYHLLYSAGYITLCFILPTTLMLVFYGFVMRVAQRRAAGYSKNPFRKPPDRENIRYSPTGRGKGGTYPMEHGAGSQTWSQGAEIHLHKLKAARILFIVIILYIACITPYFVINIALATGHWNPRGFPYVVYLGSILLLHSNSSCNPLFYGFANRRLRATLTDYIRKKLGRSGAAGSSSSMGKAEWRAQQRGRTDSRISIMGESNSDCGGVGVGGSGGGGVGFSTSNGHLTRRMSQSSDISALSCMSREAFVGRDLLDIYNGGGGHGVHSMGCCSHPGGDSCEVDDPLVGACGECNRSNTNRHHSHTSGSINNPSNAAALSVSSPLQQWPPTDNDNDQNWIATSGMAAVDSPSAITSWADAPGAEEAETERMIMLTSVGCHPREGGLKPGPTPSSVVVPIRRPLENKRSATALGQIQIAEAAMLFSVHESERGQSQRDWGSPGNATADSVLVSGGCGIPRHDADPDYAWTRTSAAE